LADSGIEVVFFTPIAEGARAAPRSAAAEQNEEKEEQSQGKIRFIMRSNHKNPSSFLATDRCRDKRFFLNLF